jgi:hypothetical protein
MELCVQPENLRMSIFCHDANSIRVCRGEMSKTNEFGWYLVRTYGRHKNFCTAYDSPVCRKNFRFVDVAIQLNLHSWSWNIFRNHYTLYQYDSWKKYTA